MMQFNQMNQPFYGYNNCATPTEFNPHVIGEGDVTSFVYPDGTIQYFFMPISQWWPQMNSNPMNNNYINPMWNPNVAAWLVRSIINPQPPPAFCQLRQRLSATPLQKQLYDMSYSKSDTAFKLKFHNDSWTSTTDLVYFYPSLRTHNWFNETQYRGSAAIQVELPPLTICHCETIQNRRCFCSPKHKNISRSYDHTNNEATTRMSVDDMSYKYESDAGEESKTSSKKHSKQNKKKHKRTTTCECYEDKPKPTENKLVVTFTDQASNCDKEQLTQTVKSTSSATLWNGSKDNVKPELWLPKTSLAKKSLEKKASKNSIHSNSSCTSDCSCHDSN